MRPYLYQFLLEDGCAPLECSLFTLVPSKTFIRNQMPFQIHSVPSKTFSRDKRLTLTHNVPFKTFSRNQIAPKLPSRVSLPVPVTKFVRKIRQIIAKFVGYKKLMSMRIDILTVVPELLESPLGHSIVGRARKKGLVEINVHNIRKYGIGPRSTVDDYCYGGDAGMVMMVEPVFRMINELKAERDYDEIIYMSPDGEQLTQGISNELSLKGNIIILCGHYKGIDERIREHLITREISVGDYVVSGGEIPAALLADSIVRLIPGVLTDETSALSDSFQDGLVSPPIYTRPVEFNGWKVPDVLLSGNPKLIQDWQMQQALERTKKLRPYLLDDKNAK